jgi:hypothetical protein
MLAGDDRIADAESLRRQNVRELAVLILDEGDETGAVGIVLDALDLRTVDFKRIKDQPARNRTVMRPLLLRPPDEILPVVSAFTGSPL